MKTVNFRRIPSTAHGVVLAFALCLPGAANAWPSLPSLPSLPNIPIPVQIPGVPWGPGHDREVDQCHQDRNRNLQVAQSNLNGAVNHRNSLTQRVSDLNQSRTRSQSGVDYLRGHLESQSRLLTQLQNINGSFGAIERALQSIDVRSQTQTSQMTASWWIATLSAASASLSGEDLLAVQNVIASIHNLMNAPDQLNRLLSVLNANSGSAKEILRSQLVDLSGNINALQAQLNQGLGDVQSIQSQIDTIHAVDIPQADSRINAYQAQVAQYTHQQCN